MDASKDVLKVVEASAPRAPVVVDSPHSGELSPPDFEHAISPERLRMTTDAYVDELFDAAPAAGATFLSALFPRTYIDPNRSLHDVDEAMLDGPWPEPLAPSQKVRQGIGLVANRDLYGPVYRRTLSVAEVQARITNYYLPYHQALSESIDDCWREFGAVWHLNCHSMRSYNGGRPLGGQAMDICVGDRDGETASLELRELIVGTLRSMGYRVAINTPYKGVELVQRYSDPANGKHSIQLEISRGLYMNENLVEKHAGFTTLRRNMSRLVQTLCAYARDQSSRVDAATAAE